MRKESTNQRQIRRWILFLPAAFLLIFWPFFVHFEQVQTHLANQSWYPNQSLASDFFLKIRSQTFTRTALVMALMLLIASILRFVHFRKDFPSKAEKETARLYFHQNKIPVNFVLPLILPFLYLVLVFLSSLCSRFPLFCRQGMVESYETIWVLAGYVVVFYYCRWLAALPAGKEDLFALAAAGSFLQGLIGLSQLAGHDFWSSKLGMSLIYLGKEQVGQIRFRFTSGETIQAYLSFYNPNYAAVYLLMMIPLLFEGSRLCRKVWQKWFCLFTTGLLILCLFATRSTAGAAVFFFLLLVKGFVTLKSKRQRQLAAGLLLFLLAVGGGGIYLFRSTIQSGDSFLAKHLQKLIPVKKEYRLTELSCQENGISFTFLGETYFFEMTEKNGKWTCSLKEENGTACKLVKTKKGVYKLKKYKNKKFTLAAYQKEDTQYLTITDRKKEWSFIKREGDSHFYYVNAWSRLDTIENAKSSFGEGYESLFTNRVYLWGRTLPLLKQTWLLGSGPDTFALVFPQNDYLRRVYVSSSLAKESITRPHSYYLQTAIQEGGAALLCQLLLCAVLFWNVIKYCQKSSAENKVKCSLKSRKISIALCFSAAGFLIMGLTNDSIVAVTPYLWGILGILANADLK